MRTNLIAAAVGAAGLVGAAAGQCPQPQWRSLASVPGVHGVAECAVEWDPDGPGPRGTLLVVGGVFDSAGEVVTRNIAAWDGERWTDELGGFETFKNGGVSALLVQEGQLIAAVRSVTDAQGNFLPGVQWWDGSAWMPIQGAPESCWSIVEFSGGIAVAADTGVHSYASGAWTALGLTSGPSTGERRVTSVISDGSGGLLACGAFTGIDGLPSNGLARWEGGAWTDMGLPQGARCWGVAEFLGALFATAQSGPGHAPTHHLLRRVGSTWEELIAPEARAFRPSVVNGHLYLLNLPPGQWGGTGPLWRQQGDGWEHVGLPLRGGGKFVSQYGGELVLAGDLMGDGVAAFRGVARLQGGQWRSFGSGLSGMILDAIVYNGELCIAGQWLCGPTGPGVQRLVNGSWQSVPGFEVSRNIMEYEGSLIGRALQGGGWLRYDGSGVFPMASPGALAEPAVVEGVLYSVGDSAIHRLDGTVWTQIAELQWTYPPVMPVQHNGLLHAAGVRFDEPDLSGFGPGSFDSNGWTFLGYFPRGLNAFSVNTLCSYAGSLFMGGAIFEDSPTGFLQRGIVRWNGQEWETVSGLPEPFGALRLGVLGHKMIVSGGTDTSVGLLSWDQTTWRWLAEVDDWTWATGGVKAWVEHEQELVMVGQFGSVNGSAAHMIATARIQPCCGSADFDGDGSPGTDADIDAFFACLAGRCCVGCAQDFDDDGDSGTDADIEAFFRVLAGGAC